MPKRSEPDKPGFYLKDEERSAYGLGWEDRRRGKGMVVNNIFIVGSWKWKLYREGWIEKDRLMKEEAAGTTNKT